jgi:hypothetical protein
MVMKNNVRFILSYENQEFRNTGYRNRRKASCALTYIISQQPENCENRNDPDLVQMIALAMAYE